MTPYYEDEQVTLYHGDALDVLPTLPAGSIDACVTDPPYVIGAVSAGNMQARAADRCARKRALWAADHCDSCPWRGCSTCEFQGGVDPNAPVAQRDSGATRRAKRRSTCDNRTEPLKRPPDGAGNTAEGLATTQLQGSSKEES